MSQKSRFLAMVLFAVPAILGAAVAGPSARQAEIEKLWSDNEHAKAERELKKWMKEESGSPDPWVTAAQFRFEDKRYKKVLALTNAALRKSPLSADAYYWRGRAYEAMNQPLEAANEYRAALLAQKDHAEAQAGLARMMNLLGTADAGSNAAVADH